MAKIKKNTTKDTNTSLQKALKSVDNMDVLFEKILRFKDDTVYNFMHAIKERDLKIQFLSKPNDE